jgi:hypothetical protein
MGLRTVLLQNGFERSATLEGQDSGVWALIGAAIVGARYLYLQSAVHFVTCLAPLPGNLTWRTLLVAEEEQWML